MAQTTCIRCKIEDDLFVVGTKSYCSKCFILVSKESRETVCSSCETENECVLRGTKYFCKDCIKYNLCKKNNTIYCVECNMIDSDELVKCDNATDYKCINCCKNDHNLKPCIHCNVVHITTICQFGPFSNKNDIYCETCKRYHDDKCKHCEHCMDFVPINWDHCRTCGDCGPKNRIH